LDIGLPLACVLIALPFRNALASGWLLAGAVLLAGWLLFRDRLPLLWRAAAGRPGTRRPAGPAPGPTGRLGSWRLWLLDAGLALALTLLSLRLEQRLDEQWAAFAVPLVVGLLIQRRWPLPAAVLACAGAVAHFYWGSFGPMPLDLAAPITVYTLASRASRRQVAVLAVGALLAGVYAASLVHELSARPSGGPIATEEGIPAPCPPYAKSNPRLGCVYPDGRWPRPPGTDAEAPESGIALEPRMAPECRPGQVWHVRFGCLYPDQLGDLARTLPEDKAAALAVPRTPPKPMVIDADPRSDTDRLVSGLLSAGGNGLLPMLILGLALAFGDSVRSRRAHLRTLEQRASDLEREQHQRMVLAAAAERARITRELHDVVAHGMSVMVVQAQGGAAALRRHPERTADALENVISTGRASLAEMRRLLGVVSRDPANDPELAPQPGLAALPALVDQVRAAGTPVRLSIEGQPAPLPVSVDLSAYRIAQEALTNTIKHAGSGASAEVRVGFTPDWIEVEVSDDGVGERVARGGDGNGLRGIAERVAMLDGVLAVGPGVAGGFRVWALLPLRPPDAPPA
jgi:signal transduction histidine kinase